MAALGATAVAAAAYAVEGTDLSKLAVGGIQSAAGVAVGTGVSMVSKGLGVGIASGGVAIGLKNVGEELMMRSALPAGANNNDNNDVSAIRANLGAIQTARGRQQLPMQSPTGLNATMAQQALNAMSAIRTRI